MSSEKFTETDQENLADIIWWIKGYIVAMADDFSSCDFRSDHIESLAKARRILREEEKAE